MLLGRIFGKITTGTFSFLAEAECKNFEYIQVYHKVYEYVLCQIIEITTTAERTVASCQVIGYRDKDRVRRPRIPFDPDTEVLSAEDDFIAAIIELPKDNGLAVLGSLEGRSIPVALDLNKVLTKHVAVLAKSGAGKSYTVGVLLEEIALKGLPFVVIDPHGEYAGLGKPSTDVEAQVSLATFDRSVQGFSVAEYADTTLHPHARPLRLSSEFSAAEIAHLLPGKLSANQQAVLYSALKNLRQVSFDSLLSELELEESPAKFSIISSIEYFRSLPYFSAAPTPYAELVKPGRATLINLKGVPPEVQALIVYKLTKDLFSLRKQNKVSPFFLVIEEAHNYCPERSFGETLASKILRDVASEGRKFGLGLCVISQRPARVDKSVLSQCSTQIILKVTNPHDLKAISNSVESMTSEAESEIKHLPVGSALVTGVAEVPLFISVRPRMSEHGGNAVDMLAAGTNQGIFEQVQDFSDQEILPLIKSSMSVQDVAIMNDVPPNQIHTVLVPAYQFACREGEDRYKLLVDRESGGIIVDKDLLAIKYLPALDKMTARQRKILQLAFSRKEITLDDLSSEGLDIEDEVAALLENNMVIKVGESIRISDQFIFSRLSTAASFDDVAYESISYHQKISSRTNLDELREKLSRFTTVEDQNECFVVHYRLAEVMSDG